MSDSTTQTFFHPAAERGYVDHNWLKSYHSFSFGSYFNPAKSGFGLLKVINDDSVAGGEGFATHGHKNMEIISVPLKGSLEHRDSEGHQGTLSAGEIQVMSAGSGIEHSEYNASPTEELNFLQIWIEPNRQNVTPQYQQRKFEFSPGKLTPVVSSEQDGDALHIHQNARILIGQFREGESWNYRSSYEGNGVYVFAIDGRWSIRNDAKETIEAKDALGFLPGEAIQGKALGEGRIMIIDVPMVGNS